MTYAKAFEIYGNPLPDIIDLRIEKELSSILGNGFAVIYLASQMLVHRSNERGYLVGSRGSVGRLCRHHDRDHRSQPHAPSLCLSKLPALRIHHRWFLRFWF